MTYFHSLLIGILLVSSWMSLLSTKQHQIQLVAQNLYCHGQFRYGSVIERKFLFKELCLFYDFWLFSSTLWFSAVWQTAHLVTRSLFQLEWKVSAPGSNYCSDVCNSTLNLYQKYLTYEMQFFPSSINLRKVKVVVLLSKHVKHVYFLLPEGWQCEWREILFWRKT